MWGFMNSIFFQTLMMFLIGTFIFVDYVIRRRSTKKDELKNAARLITIELRHIAAAVSDIKSNENLDYDKSVITTNNWAKYNYLFRDLLDNDQWEIIDDTYDMARILDEILQNHRQNFWNDVEQNRVNRSRALADFVKDTVIRIGDEAETKSAEYTKDEVSNMTKELESKFKVFDTFYMNNDDRVYEPRRINQAAQKYIGEMPDIMNSVAFDRLKQIARKGKIKKVK